MSIQLDEKYKKLKEIALSAEKFVVYDGELYTGPINPTAIIVETFIKTNRLAFSLVLAELVRPEDLGEQLGTQHWDKESPGGCITARLNGDFEFEKWDSASKTLVVDDFINSPDGTLWGYCENHVRKYPNAGTSMALLFVEQQGIGSTCRLMQRV